MTNTRVIEMSKLGLDDEIIIARIKNANCWFQLEDADLVDLKKAGVAPKVIAAMVDSSALSSPRVTINKNEVRTPATSPLQTRQKISCYYSADKVALELVIDRNSDTQSRLETWGLYSMKEKWTGDTFYSTESTRKLSEQLLITPNEIKLDTQMRDKDREGNKEIVHFLITVNRDSNTFTERYSTYRDKQETPRETHTGTCSVDYNW